MPSPQQRSLMFFDSATVETLMSAMHDNVAAATIQLRLRYLQRFDFPPGAKAGRGKRAVYGLADLLKIALAFEMLDLDITPQRAAATIMASWPALEKCLAPTWVAVRLVAHKGIEASADRVDKLTSIIIVEPEALSGDEAGHIIGLLRPSAFGASMACPGGGFRKCMLIDLFAVVAALDAALQSEPLGFRRSEIDAVVERLGVSLHGAWWTPEWTPEHND
jgi:hypothetical protein